MSFEPILSGSVPCFKIAENDEFLAFLETAPLAKGHTLVIPKQKVESLFEMEDSALGRIQIFAKSVALKLKSAIPCRRIGMAVIGLGANRIFGERLKALGILKKFNGLA